MSRPISRRVHLWHNDHNWTVKFKLLCFYDGNQQAWLSDGSQLTSQRNGWWEKVKTGLLQLNGVFTFSADCLGGIKLVQTISPVLLPIFVQITSSISEIFYFTILGGRKRILQTLERFLSEFLLFWFTFKFQIRSICSQITVKNKISEEHIDLSNEFLYFFFFTDFIEFIFWPFL